MEREERVITRVCVNWIVPLAIIGLFANFIPWLLVIIPLEEQDVCWFYFLTRSPYQLDFIPQGLYDTATGVKYSLWTIELMVLFYYCYQIRNMKLD